MLKPPARLQPSYYEAFRCVGSVCEDTCCSGWRVPVDEETYNKYQGCSHATLGPKLKALVTLNPNPESTESWAEIELNQGVCNFLSEGLCEIHATLGADHLSKNCAIYPRVMATVDGVVERSLDLSCPEAARLALSNPEPILFVTSMDCDDERLGSLGVVDTSNSKHPDKPFRFVDEVRRLMIALLQNRGYPLSHRLLVLGRLCDKLEEEGTDQGCGGLQDAAREPLSIAHSPSMKSTDRFETVVELILARIGADATSRRFLNCYQSVMSGLHWQEDSTIEQLAHNLDAAFDGPYAKFRSEHGYMLEHYLVAYVFRSLFPFGSKSVNRKLAQHRFEHSISRQYQLMVVDYVIVETLLAGLAVFYGERFGIPEALVLIQSATKTFEHSLTYPGKAVELLDQKGLTDCASIGMLIRD
jgi:lysine-N-methylase